MTIASRLLEVLKTVTGNEQVNRDLDLQLFDTQVLDSMMTIELVVAVSRELGIDIPLADFDRDKWATPRLIIADVERRINEQGGYKDARTEDSENAFAMNPRGTLLPFFCLPGLLHLARHLDRVQPFYGLSFPPSDVLARPDTTIEGIAAGCIRQIRSMQPAGPYYLGGYSYGGVVTFEIARQLAEQGEKIALLVMFDPDPPRPYPAGFLAQHLRRYLHHFRRLSRLNPGSQLRYLAQGLRNKAAKLIPPVFRNDEAENQMQIFVRLSEAIHQRYHAKVYDGSVKIFLAEDTHWRQPPEKDPRMEWCKFVSGSTEIEVIPGDHEILYQEPHVQTLAEKLDHCLKNARSEPAPGAHGRSRLDITALFAILTAFWA